MANTRDSSKQKRARQNRAQREARQARTEAASTTAEVRRAKYASSTPSASSSGSKKGGTSSRNSGRPARPPRPGDVPVDIDTLEGNWFSKRVQVPGGRHVLTGSALGIVLTGMLVFLPFPIIPKGTKASGTGQAAKVQKGIISLGGQVTEDLFHRYGPWAALILLVPLVVLAVACIKILSPHRRRWWTAAAVLLAVEAVAFPYFLASAGFIYYAVMRSKKVEGFGSAPADDGDEDGADDLDPEDSDEGDAEDDDGVAERPSRTRRARRTRAASSSSSASDDDVDVDPDDG